MDEEDERQRVPDPDMEYEAENERAHEQPEIAHEHEVLDIPPADD